MKLLTLSTTSLAIAISYVSASRSIATSPDDGVATTHDEDAKVGMLPVERIQQRETTEALDYQTYWNSLTDNPYDDKKHFMVKWTSERGHAMIRNMTHVTVLHDFAEDAYVAVEVEETYLAGVLEQLVFDPDVEAVEEDSLWVEQGSMDAILTDDEVRRLQEVDDSSTSSSNGATRRRKLAEVVPYGIKMIQADKIGTGGNRALVCIVDTGVSYGHPDLDFNKITGADRKSNRDSTTLQWGGDTRGHGTHIAGTVAAKASNGIGVRGVGTMPLYITRGLNNAGQAYESDVRDAMEQCLSAGARVISLSLAGSQISSSMMASLDKMYNNGILIFAASGNGGGPNKAFPAAYSKVISVGAVNSQGTRWRGSNYGWNELMAPGDLVTSTSINSNGAYVYANYSGTSMATPHAAGAAALLWSHFPACTNTQIRFALAYTAQDVDSNGCDTTYGYGIVKVKNAYDFLAGYPCKGANWGQKLSSGGCTTLDVTPKKANQNKGSGTSWVKNVWWK